MIEVDRLSKRFGSTRAVDQISFQIRRGEVVGFLGPNGAGKTTTMRLMTRYLTADSGTVLIDGIDVQEDPLSVRRRVGYLPESAPLYHDLSVIESLKFVAAIRGIPRTARKERLSEVISVCGLGNVLTRDVGVLSKGFRQRVGLAQTLIHDPDILILDEPTSGLDPNQIVEIRELIRSIGREKTIIISSHILAEVQASCGRVLILHQGKIVGDGTAAGLAEQLQGNPRYFVLVVGEQQAIETALVEADFVSRFDRGDDEGEALGYTVSGMAQETRLGEKLFHLAGKHGLVLIEMRRESCSLEAVFSSLTRGEGCG
ncbi:MAG: ATP-binding cassette domain-containing protein [Planctomycetota bacterium]